MPQAFDNEERDRRALFTRRMVAGGILQVAGFGVIGARLFQLQVTGESRYRLLADSNRITTQLLAPERGRILDRFGEVLVSGEEAFRAIFVPSLAEDVDGVLELFSRVVPIDAGKVERLRSRVKRQRPNEPIILAEDLDFEQVAQLGLLAPRLPGVETEPAARRQYRKGRIAGHVVGYVGHVESVAIDDDPILALPWMRAGKTGLERGMEKRLRGRSGRLRMEVDARGRIVRTVDRSEPVAGEDVITTIDVVLQARVQERLSAERRAAVVVMDVASGEVVVMASEPDYDPGAIVEGLSNAAWQQMKDAADDPFVNRAIAGQYPPGSTFKMVTALAALESGVVVPRKRFRCNGRFHLAGQTYRCWNRGGHGSLDMVGALRESCDVYFYELAQRTGIDAIGKMAHRLGLGETFACGLELQKPGVVPGRDWKIGRFGRRWVNGETILTGIGQGYVLSTPLQLAVMTARIACGRAIMPTLVRAHGSGGGGGDLVKARLQTITEVAAKDLQIAPESLDLVRRGMFACVNDEGGTGSRAQLEGSTVRVAGKTGTSQVIRAAAARRNDSSGWEQQDHALFVAYAPAERPRYAIATVIEHGGSGGVAAAVVARDILAMVLERDPTGRKGDDTPGNTDAAVPRRDQGADAQRG